MFKSFLTKWPFLYKLRLILALIILIFIIVCLYFKIVPFGQITYHKSWPQFLGSGKGFIYNFTPGERISSTDRQLPRIIGDPIYFSLFTPRTFDQAKVTIKYREKLTDQTPIIELGLLMDKLVWRYNLQPLENQIIDRLRSNWLVRGGDGLVLLQSNSNYDNLTEFEGDLAKGFLQDCPGGPTYCLAVYNYQPDYTYLLPDQSRGKPLTINNPLRGAHQFYIYLKDEPLRLDFEFVDLNQDREADPITVTLYSGQQNIANQFLEDENPNPTSGDIEEKYLSLEKKELPQGVYKVEVRASNDIVIRKIFSSVHHLSFINKLWPVSTVGNLTLFTDSNHLQIKAMSPASLQTITFADQDYTINETYQQFSFQTTSQAATKMIKFSQDDLILENAGVFSWNEDNLFNPNFKKVDRFFYPDENIKYIIAEYNSPLEENGFKVASASFNLRGAYREKGKYSFIISIPGLRAEDGETDYLEIKEIKIELTGRTLWQKIFH